MPTIHFELYSGQEKFSNCSCHSTQKKAYSLLHQPRPLKQSEEFFTAVETLLWYSPNIASSAQSHNNDFLKYKLYENAVIDYLLNFSDRSNRPFMRITPKDILFIDDFTVSEEYLAPYIEKACSCCNKIIVTQKKYESKFTCILRHLRNIIAHGRFNFISENHIIGFDIDTNRRGYTAMFKLDINVLSSFCKQLIQHPDFTLSNLFCYILRKDGFLSANTITSACQIYDKEHFVEEELVFAIKNDFAIRINCSRHLSTHTPEEIRTIIEPRILYEEFDENITYQDIYYCEDEQSAIRTVGQAQYVIGRKGLEALFTGTSISELIKIRNY